MNRSDLGMSDLTDIERVEVLQGPQGTLYGKNSNAGVISIATKKPNFEETGGFVEATAGDFGLEQYTGSVTGPLNDKFAYRLSGSWRQEDGWLENGTGPDQGSAEDWNLRGKLEWLPTEDLGILLTASHVDRDDRCCGADALQTPVVLDELQARGMPLPKNDAFDWKNNIDQSSEFTMNADTAVVTIDYDLDWAQLTSLSAWNDYSYKTSTDADRSQLDVMSIVDDRYDGNSLSQEFRLTSNLDGPLQYIAGLYFVELENTRGNGTPFVFLGDDFLTIATRQVSPVGLDSQASSHRQRQPLGGRGLGHLHSRNHQDLLSPHPRHAALGGQEAKERGRVGQGNAPRHPGMVSRPNPRFLGDGAYSTKNLLGDLDPRVTYMGVMRSDAAIYYPVPTKQSKSKRGPKAKKGPRLPNPKEAMKNADRNRSGRGPWAWQTVKAPAYGVTRKLRVVSFRAVWPEVLGLRPILVVLVRDPRGKF